MCSNQEPSALDIKRVDILGATDDFLLVRANQGLKTGMVTASLTAMLSSVRSNLTK